MRQKTTTNGALVTLVVACVLVGGLLDLSAATRPVEREWTWQPLATGGFADAGTYQMGALSMVEFDGHLLVSTIGFSTGGNEPGVWRRGDDLSWQRVFAVDDRIAVGPMVEFNGSLYTAVDRNRLQRSTAGVEWQEVSSFGSGANLVAVVNGSLLAAKYPFSGAELWTSADGETWTKMVTGGFGDINNTSVAAIAGADGVIFVGTVNHETGGEVWVSNDGGFNWAQSNEDGFGNADNRRVADLHIRPSGELYAAADNYYGGATVWKKASASAPWELVTGDAFGTHGIVVEGFTEFGGDLWVGVATNVNVGGQVWRLAPDGAWHAVVVGGISDPHNEHIMSILPLGDSLVFGTYNMNGGCEIWQMSPTAVSR